MICAIGVLDDKYELDSLTKLAGQVAGDRRHGDARRRPAGCDLRSLGRHRHVGARPRRRHSGHHPDHRAHHQRDQLHRRARRAGRRRHRDRSARVLRLRLPPRRDRRGRRLRRPRRCSARPWPAPAWASCRTTSPRPGSSWATPARCSSVWCSPPRRRPRRPAPIRRRSAGCSDRFRSRCRCSSRLPVLAIPFVDLLLADRAAGRPRTVAVRAGQAAPAPPDAARSATRHRRAVLLLYFWSALLAFGGVALSIMSTPWVVVICLAVFVVLGVVLSARPDLLAHYRPRHPAARQRHRVGAGRSSE